MKLEYENLLGKPWIINEQDCFTLGRDFYKQNFGIDIPDFSRPNDWDADELDLIRINSLKSGFKIITDEDWNDLRPGDILAVAINSSNANHLVVYVGNNEIIHHLFFKTSCKEILRPIWRMSTMYILRHPDVPDLRPEVPSTTFEEVLRARFPREV